MNNTLCSNEQALLGIQLILFVLKSSILCLWQSRHFVKCRATLQSPASVWGAHLHCNCWRKTKAWRLFPLLFAGTWRVFIQKRITCFIHVVDGRQHALLRERVDGYQQKRESPFFYRGIHEYVHLHAGLLGVCFCSSVGKKSNISNFDC